MNFFWVLYKCYRFLFLFVSIDAEYREFRDLYIQNFDLNFFGYEILSFWGF